MDLHHCICLVGSISAAATSNTGRDSDGMDVCVGEAVPVVCLTHLHLHHLSPTRVGILVSQESPKEFLEVRVENKIKKDIDK